MNSDEEGPTTRLKMEINNTTIIEKKSNQKMPAGEKFIEEKPE